MSQQPLLISGEAIADASVDALLTTAQALVREAVTKARVGTADTSRDELVGQVIACQRLQNSAWAAQSVRMAQVAAIEEVATPDGRLREVRHAIGGYADEWLPQEIGTRLGWSDRQTTHRLTEAVDSIRHLPRMFDRTACGSLDPRKLNAVADTLCGVRPEVSRKIEGRLLEAMAEGELTSTKLVRRTRRMVADLAPADADEAAQQRRANATSVRVYPHHEPGLSTFHAVLPTEDVMRVMAAINELARHLHKDTTTEKSLDECRVDAFVDLLLGNASISTTCVIQIPLFPVGAGADDGPAGGLSGGGTVRFHCSWCGGSTVDAGESRCSDACHGQSAAGPVRSARFRVLRRAAVAAAARPDRGRRDRPTDRGTRANFERRRPISVSSGVVA